MWPWIPTEPDVKEQLGDVAGALVGDPGYLSDAGLRLHHGKCPDVNIYCALVLFEFLCPWAAKVHMDDLPKEDFLLWTNQGIVLYLLCVPSLYC